MLSFHNHSHLTFLSPLEAQATLHFASYNRGKSISQLVFLPSAPEHCPQHTLDSTSEQCCSQQILSQYITASINVYKRSEIYLNFSCKVCFYLAFIFSLYWNLQIFCNNYREGISTKERGGAKVILAYLEVSAVSFT